MMHDDLFALQQKVARKPLLECKLYELSSQRRQYDSQVISLRVAFRKEQQDVEKLEGRSLSNYFYQVVGKLDEKLDQERKEAYAARVKLDAAERELAGIESDIKEIQEQITDVLVAEARYNDALELKRRQLKASGTEIADQIFAMEERIAALQAQKHEIKEAISAGYSARSTADRILSELEDADGWNTWDTHARRKTLPDVVSAVLEELNIPAEKATYVSELYTDEDGVHYQFSYRLSGTILAAPSQEVTGLGRCCHEPYPYGAPNFPEPHFDLEFWVTLPWILEESDR